MGSWRSQQKSFCSEEACEKGRKKNIRRHTQDRASVLGISLGPGTAPCTVSRRWQLGHCEG